MRAYLAPRIGRRGLRPLDPTDGRPPSRSDRTPKIVANWFRRRGISPAIRDNRPSPTLLRPRVVAPCRPPHAFMGARQRIHAARAPHFMPRAHAFMGPPTHSGIRASHATTRRGGRGAEPLVIQAKLESKKSPSPLAGRGSGGGAYLILRGCANWDPTEKLGQQVNVLQHVARGRGL